jgi:hypothetical protein
VTQLGHYSYAGARALVILHEQSLRDFLDTWRQTRAANLALPETDDPTYRSYEALLQHVFKWSRDYMVWMCEKLGLPDPEISHAPSLEKITTECDRYVEHLLDKWRTPLENVRQERFSERTYRSRWNVEYCIDAMLEHAVMHPARHRL